MVGMVIRRIAPLAPLAVALTLVVSSAQAGQVVRLDPRGEGQGDANLRDEAALRNAYSQAYGGSFPGYDQALRSTGSREGAFVTFQKALVLLSTDGDDVRAQAARGADPFFDPNYPPAPLAPRGSAGTLIPTGYQLTGPDASSNPPKIFAPSDATLSRIARLSEDLARAREWGDQTEIARLNREFLTVMQGEIQEVAQRIRDGEQLTGLGVVDRQGSLEPVKLDPDVLLQGIEEIAGGASQPEDTTPPPGGGTVPELAGITDRSTRSQSPRVTDHLERVVARLDEPMDNAERDLFELDNDGGFHFRSPPSYLDGTAPGGAGEASVKTYDLYQAYPGDVVAGGLNLPSRRTR